MSSDRMLVLDTEAEVDALYYGTAFIDGLATIKGATDELVINVNAATERGTIFKIPLSDAESVGDNSYIHFLSPEEKASRLAGEEIELPEVKGLELNFDLDITNDAEVEVVIDQTSGSTLRGRGAGSMLIEINTNGKFNMWGDFVVYEGVYNFKYAGLVQKIFRVKPGGNITWNGSPTQAELDVSAVYDVTANPAVLLENPSLNRKIPVEVVILLQGQIAQPELTFDVEFPNASSAVRSELEYRMNDRASRELQALFLVTQGSFYSEMAIGQNAITGNLVERASSIVNDIFADEDGKFQVGVNYVQGDRTPDQQTVDRFGLTLSTQISDRVLINGAVGVPVGGVTESVIIGDVEIQFLLNEEGTLRAKVFNRENNIQFIGEEIGFTQGLGLTYSVDFDTFKELIRKIANTQAIKQEEGEGVSDKKSLAPEYIVFPEQ
ncbi:translocation/assembly module TamB [Antarcticibacterium sp. 1MA-6-2]|nr:translocation/assembly module TamB [Antarcticibacterium sp. 1MA-6-2]